MRDYLVTFLVFGSLPFILGKPFLGVLVWTWLSLMNPHRMSWDFAASMPFAFLTAIVLLVAIVISKEPKRLPSVALVKLLALWWAWMLITTFSALNPPGAWELWSKVWRIMLITFATILLLDSRERLHALIWVMAISLGAYGVKGGIFTLVTGGGYNVQGPEGTFIGGNNELGLALVMTVPLMRYLQLATTRKLVKNGLLVSMGLTFMAILGTQSRGALVGLSAMILYLALMSRNRLRLMVLLALILVPAFLFMPKSYYTRMDTIGTYQEDASAMGRINAWWVAWNIAVDRPVVGGGFEVFTPKIFLVYAPKPLDYHDVHSIYFEALGEHGFIGLALFLAIGATAMRSLGRVARFARPHPELVWMRDMATMVQVSLIGYAVSGAFLGLAYFDYYYALIAVAIGLQRLKNSYESEGIPSPAPAANPLPAPRRGPGVGPGAPRRPSLGLAMRSWYSKI